MAELRINGVLQGQYTYDFVGRQAIRTLTSTFQTTHSVFDSSGNRIAEYDASSGQLLREYIWNGLTPVAVVENGAVYFVRVDHIGRPVFATDSSGAKVWTATYTPFGEVHTSTGAPIAIRFPGQWFQSESGLHQNWMREYDPTTGRYLQADPLGLVDGASVYGYALQNPGRWIDPTGKQTWGPQFPFDGTSGLSGFDYDPRVLPGSRPDPNHNFPTSYDDEVMMNGSICGCGVTTEGLYTERSLPGTLNGKDGYYELGIITPWDSAPRVVHRFFNPKPKTVCLPFWPRLP